MDNRNGFVEIFVNTGNSLVKLLKERKKENPRTYVCIKIAYPEISNRRPFVINNNLHDF